jgi:hypothetical protein
MSYLEVAGAITTLIGIGTGFGIQSNRITTLQKNTNDLGKLHRETVAVLHGIRVEIAELRKDIEYIKQK